MKTKIYVGKYTTRFQEKLFALDFRWVFGDTDLVKSASFLYIDWDSKTLSFGNDWELFIRRSSIELPLGEFIKKLEKLEVEQKIKEKTTRFKPFDRILVRDFEDHPWLPALFCDYYEGNYNPYVCIAPAASYRYAIPYEGNEHLANKKE